MNKFLNWIRGEFRRLPERGTVVIAIIFQGSLANASHIVDVSATATSDVTATIPHGLGRTPVEIDLEPRAALAFPLSQWFVNGTLTNSTNAVLIKLSTANSALATRQLRVHIKVPHTKTQ